MNLRRLSYFLRIAELGSMNRASEALGIAQPALTRQVRVLEEEVGAMLFERTAQGVVLTEKGEQLRQDTIAPLRQLNFAVSNLRLSSDLLAGSVTLGLTPSIAYVLAAPVLKMVSAAEPRLSVRIVETDVDTLIEWLIEGKVDMALLYGPSPDQRILDRPMLLEDLLLVGPKSANLTPKTAVPFKRLAQYPLILPSSKHGIMATLEKTSYITKADVNIAVQVDSFQITKQLVIAGEGFTILPYSAIEREVRAGLLSYTKVDNPTLTRQVVTAATEHCRAPRLVSHLDVLIQKKIAELSKAGHWPGKLLVDPADT